MASILVVEHDAGLRGRLTAHLRSANHFVRASGDLAGARRDLAALAPDALVVGFDLVDGDGIDLLREVRRDRVNLPVIMITARQDNALAVTAMREGAYDFIREPVDGDELLVALARALAAQRHTQPVSVPVQEDPLGVSGLVGGSRAIVDVCKRIGRVAPTGTSVLIAGESGTGKEIVARAIHAYSGCTGPFQPVNCAAIIDTLLESELFGHEKGSFTGAIARRQGKFELAGGGVLFLDEIGELPLHLQAKLLRVLQEGVFERVGGSQLLRTTARIVAASNRDLGEMVQAGRFREDLYYRINVVTLTVPPLRERLEDMPALVDHLLGRIVARLNGRVPRVSAAALRVLTAHVWPGNVRELENVLTRAVIMNHGDILTPDLLDIEPLVRTPGSEPCRPTEGAALPLFSLDELEARHVAAVLAHTRWHRGQACAILGISRPALERKIRKHNLAAE